MIGARCFPVLLAALLIALGASPSGSMSVRTVEPVGAPHGLANSSPVSNFSASIGRLVAIVAAGGGGLLALVWARVALSWFSNDVTKKVQAKDRARDALIGTLIFAGAISGLAWALAQWVVTGT